MKQAIPPPNSQATVFNRFVPLDLICSLIQLSKKQPLFGCDLHLVMAPLLQSGEINDGTHRHRFLRSCSAVLQP